MGRVDGSGGQISRVHYPGLESHPEYLIAKKQMEAGYGGVISFEVGGTHHPCSILKKQKYTDASISYALSR